MEHEQNRQNVFHITDGKLAILTTARVLQKEHQNSIIFNPFI